MSLNNNDKKLLENLIDTHSPSGDEHQLCNFIKEVSSPKNAKIINK